MHGCENASFFGGGELLQRVQYCCQTHQVRSDSSYAHLNYWSNILILHYTELLSLKNEKACVKIQSFHTNLHKEIQIKLCVYRKMLINFMLCIQCGCSSYISVIFGLHNCGRLHFCSVCCYLFFCYVLLLHISLFIFMHYPIHVALTSFIRLLHHLFCYVFAVYLCCVGCSCFTASFCGYWLWLPDLFLLMCGLTLHMWEKLTPTE